MHFDAPFLNAPSTPLLSIKGAACYPANAIGGSPATGQQPSSPGRPFGGHFAAAAVTKYMHLCCSVLALALIENHGRDQPLLTEGFCPCPYRLPLQHCIQNRWRLPRLESVHHFIAMPAKG